MKLSETYIWQDGSGYIKSFDSQKEFEFERKALDQQGLLLVDVNRSLPKEIGTLFQHAFRGEENDGKWSILPAYDYAIIPTGKIEALKSWLNQYNLKEHPEISPSLLVFLNYYINVQPGDKYGLVYKK